MGNVMHIGINMDIQDYISLLVTLKQSSQTIWGYLLTVSLGAVAFIGSAKDIKPLTTICLAILFIGFAAGNYHALDKNFKAREAIDKIISVDDSYNANSELIKNLVPKKEFWLLSDLTTRQGNLLFQAFISFFVAIILAISGYQMHNKSLNQIGAKNAPPG